MCLKLVKKSNRFRSNVPLSLDAKTSKKQKSLQRLRKEENVVTGLDYLENVMSTKHPWINRAGIGLPILGLIGQLVSSFFP